MSHTSPTNIAAYLWSTLAAEASISSALPKPRSRLDRTLATLAGMDRTHGFFFNHLDPRTGAVLKVSPFDSSPVEPHLSAVDNAWLAVGADDGGQLRVVVAGTRGRLLDRLISASSTTLTTRPIPSAIRDSFTWATGQTIRRSTATTGCSIRRPASQLPRHRPRPTPAEHYYRMFRTLPEIWGPQQQSPRGKSRDYDGVKVFEGSYYYRAPDRPELGREHVRGLDGPALRPRRCLGPAKLGDHTPASMSGPRCHGLEEVGSAGFLTRLCREADTRSTA